MATKMSFPQAGFLNHLELLGESTSPVAGAALSPLLARILLASNETTMELTSAAGCLVQLLKAAQATLQATFDTELAADELRRYQKFAKPGQPSPHIVQLRQKQAAARQASSQSKQSFIKAAAAFVREAGIEVPQRVALEEFITHWIDANVPKDFSR
ncbi:hypothetical protein [Rhodanobacter sp. C05]|uniref:hypothetical protein n=1 Tax=Rhodanobacter sp. C05 TaxID=1945855 RepID=UPI000984DC6B|nr:hypothetical protein [Rhodanobacter sp. C05]OOG40198.1 hypothetical protein B0E51_10120 [Rhodanobacter sp. C05]